MDLALKIYGLNTITINTEMIILDQYKRPADAVLISLVDSSSKVDKIRMDYKKKVNLTPSLIDREYNTYLDNVNMNNVEYTIQKKPHGILSHMMFYQDLKSPYIYHFNKEEAIEELVLKKIINTYFVPGNIELVKEIMKKNQELYSKDEIDELIIRPLKIYVSNDEFKDIKAYKFSIEAYKETMDLLAKEKGEEVDPIFIKLKNNFTEYIKTFKDNIVENLFDKIETFYDKNNVPKYVTEFPRPLPDKQMKKMLEFISNKMFQKNLSELTLIESNSVYKKYDELKEKIKDKDFGDWSKQYRIWAAGIEILKSEKFLYLSLIMGAGRKNCIKYN